MKLNELKVYGASYKPKEGDWSFFFVLPLTDEFTKQDADNIYQEIWELGSGAKYDKFNIVDEIFNAQQYAVIFDSMSEARQAKKRLQRLSRGRPRFQIDYFEIAYWDPTRASQEDSPGWVAVETRG